MKRGRLRVSALAVALCLLLVACASDEPGALVAEAPEASAADYAYRIPLGTAERISSGEPVEILPAQLDVTVGEVIQIVNEDEEGHFVGIFYVGAGETVTQRFASAGEFVGQCSVHPSGQLTLTVSE
jgi:plastocyanin